MAHKDKKSKQKGKVPEPVKVEEVKKIEPEVKSEKKVVKWTGVVFVKPWDLPEQTSPIKGHKKKHIHAKEPDMSDTANNMVKTTSDFILAGVGITAMAGLGGAMISALKPK